MPKRKAVKKQKSSNKKASAPTLRIANLSEFKQDHENANLHTPQGKELLKKSLAQRGFGRPTFSAADKTIIAGNLSIATAQELKMREAVVVETDGKRPVIHLRTDITNSKTKIARRLALEDNRIGELSLTWDQEVLQNLIKKDATILNELWNDSDIDKALGKINFEEYDQSLKHETICPYCKKSF